MNTFDTASKIEQAVEVFNRLGMETKAGTVVVLQTHANHPAGGCDLYLDDDALRTLVEVCIVVRSISRGLQSMGLQDLEGER